MPRKNQDSARDEGTPIIYLRLTEDEARETNFIFTHQHASADVRVMTGVKRRLQKRMREEGWLR